ncbi:hypothetical protein J2Y38_004003 [Flavobacterium sp. 2755]|nr:hypothetical protein [Flavobacterium sp. 2755]
MKTKLHFLHDSDELLNSIFEEYSLAGFRMRKH